MLLRVPWPRNHKGALALPIMAPSAPEQEKECLVSPQSEGGSRGSMSMLSSSSMILMSMSESLSMPLERFIERAGSNCLEGPQAEARGFLLNVPMDLPRRWRY